MVRVGFVDCDTSHVVEFTRRLNHLGIDRDQWVDGAEVVAAVPGESLISPDVIPRQVQQLRDYGIAIVDRPSDLVGKIDAVIISSQDGSVHLKPSLEFIEAGLPTFVDKPFTTSVRDARTIVDAAAKRGVPLLSASALRYALEIRDVQNRSAEIGPLRGADTYGPASLHPRNPGLFHYGIHAVEMLFTLLGPGCESVRSIWADGAEISVGRWSDGRLGSVRGTRDSAYAFGFAAFGVKKVVSAVVDGRYYYRELLRAVVSMFESGKSPLSGVELVEPVAFQQAALLSSRRNGEVVEFAELKGPTTVTF